MINRLDYRNGNGISHYRMDACLGAASTQGATKVNHCEDPVVPLFHFKAEEAMEQTLLRWFGNICTDGGLKDIATVRAYGMSGSASILEYDRSVLADFKTRVKSIDEYLLAGGYDGLQWARETIALKNILSGLVLSAGDRPGITGLVLRKLDPGEGLRLVNVFTLMPASQKLAG